MEEIWKEIDGYPNYMVSSKGRVKSLERYDKLGRLVKEKILKQGADGGGYKILMLYNDGKHKNFHSHRLVAQAFLDNPYNLPEVNHKDENKQNNCVENLEYCDKKYNNNYGKLTHEFRSEKVSGENHPQSRLTKKQVSQIRDLYEQGHSITNLSKTFGVCRQHVWDIVKKIKWKNI